METFQIPSSPAQVRPKPDPEKGRYRHDPKKGKARYQHPPGDRAHYSDIRDPPVKKS